MSEVWAKLTPAQQQWCIDFARLLRRIQDAQAARRQAEQQQEAA